MLAAVQKISGEAPQGHSRAAQQHDNAADNDQSDPENNQNPAYLRHIESLSRARHQSTDTLCSVGIILQTARLTLREFEPEDAAALSQILGDPETMRFYPAPLDRAGVENWIQRNRQRYEDDGVGLWAMVLRDTTEVIGDCGIVRQEIEGDSLYEIGYHLRRDLLGQGLATEAATACREWGFAHLPIDRLISLIRPENLPSRRVAERNGMTIWKEISWRGVPHCVYSVRKAVPPQHC